MKESDASDEELVEILLEAVRGLESLELGQVDQIFAPVKTGFRGVRPAIVKQLQAHAVGAVLALRSRGDTIEEAEHKVSKAFGVKPDALHKWSTKFKETKIESLLQILAHYKTTVKFPAKLSKQRILIEVKRKGEIYKKALPLKKVKKSK